MNHHGGNNEQHIIMLPPGKTTPPNIKPKHHLLTPNLKPKPCLFKSYFLINSKSPTPKPIKTIPIIIHISYLNIKPFFFKLDF